MPVVPQVDVDRACAAQNEEHQIDAQADGNDERTDEGVVGYGCRCRPAHVEDLKFEAVDFNNLGQCRRHRIYEQCGNNTQTDEADAHEEAGFEGFGETDADAYAENGEDDRHHHCGTKTDNVAKYCFH